MPLSLVSSNLVLTAYARCRHLRRSRVFLRSFARIVAAVVALSTQQLVASRAQTPSAFSAVSCDEFKERLVKAGIVLEFQIPTPTFQRVPTAASEYWWVSYSQKHFEADMSCRDGKFQAYEFYDYSVRTPADLASHLPSYQLLAASVYAYTGWQPREVFKEISDLLGSAKDEGIAGTLPLPNGGVAHLWITTKSSGAAHLTIQLSGDGSK